MDELERDKFERNFVEMLKDGVHKGIFEERDLKMRAFAILGAINWIPRWYSPEGKYKPEEIGRAMTDFLINGLAPAKAQIPRREKVSRDKVTQGAA